MRVWFDILLLFGIMAFCKTSVLAAGTQAIGLDRLLSAADWLNAKPTPQSLRGKVVLVDFYTFDCFNCKNVEPNLRALYRSKSRSDLIILGVHSPEKDMERARGNLIASMKEQGVVWPIAVDNDFTVWHAYGVEAWPTQMLFDRSGHLRKTIVGDSQDATVNAAINELIAEK